MLTEFTRADQIIQEFASWEQSADDKPLNNFADIIMLAGYKVELEQLDKRSDRSSEQAERINEAIKKLHKYLGNLNIEALAKDELARLKGIKGEIIFQPDNYRAVQELTSFLAHKASSGASWSALLHDLKKLRKERRFDDKTDAVENIIPKNDEDYIFRRTTIRRILENCNKHTDEVYREIEPLLKAVIDFRSYFVPEGVFANLRRLIKSKGADEQNLASIKEAFDQAEKTLNNSNLTDKQRQVLVSALQFALTSVQRRLEHIHTHDEALSAFQQELETRQKKFSNSYTLYAPIPQKTMVIEEIPDTGPVVDQTADVVESDEAIFQSAQGALAGKEHLLKKVKKLGEGNFGEVYLFEYLPDAENPCPLLDKLCVEQVGKDGNKHFYIVIKNSKVKSVDDLEAFKKEAVIGYRLSNENGSLLENAAYNLTYPAYYNGELVILSQFAQAGPAQNTLDSLHVNLPYFSQIEGLEEGPGDEAQDFIKRDLDILLLQMMDSLRESLHALHEKGLLHDDIALRNCLCSVFNGREIKLQLADYGQSKFVDQSGRAVADSSICPLQWASPDRMLYAEEAYTQLVDLHAAKTTLMELLAATLLGASQATSIIYVKRPDETPTDTAVALMEKQASAPALSIYFTHLKDKLAGAGFDIRKVDQVLERFKSYLIANPEDEWVKNGRRFDKSEIDTFLQQDYENFLSIKEQYIEEKFAALKSQYQQAKQPEDKIKLAPQLMRSLDRLQKIIVSDAFKQKLVYKELQTLYQTAIEDSKIYIEQTFASLTTQFNEAEDKIQLSLQIAPILRYLHSIDLGPDFQSSDSYQSLQDFYYKTVENCHIYAKNKLASLREEFAKAPDESKLVLAAKILSELESLKSIKIGFESQSDEFYQDLQQLYYQAVQYNIKGELQSLEAQLDEAKSTDGFVSQIALAVEHLKNTDAGPDFQGSTLYQALQQLYVAALKYNEVCIERKLGELKAEYQKEYGKGEITTKIQQELSDLKKMPVTPDFKQGAVYKALSEFSQQLATTELKFATWAQNIANQSQHSVGPKTSAFPVFLSDKSTEVRTYGAEKLPVNYAGLFKQRAKSIQEAVLKVLANNNIQPTQEFAEWFKARMEAYNDNIRAIFVDQLDAEDFETKFDEARRELSQLIVDSYASVKKLSPLFKSSNKFIKAVRQAESALVAEQGWDNIFNQYQVSGPEKANVTIINAILPLSKNPSTARSQKGPFNANCEIIAFKDADNNVDVAQKLWRGSIDPIKIKNRTERETEAYNGLLEIVHAMVKDRLASGQQQPIDLKIAWMSLLSTWAGDGIREIFSKGTSENGQLEVIRAAWNKLGQEFAKGKVLHIEGKEVKVKIQAIGMNMPVAKYHTRMQSDIQKEVNSKGLYEYCSFMATLVEGISFGESDQETLVKHQLKALNTILNNAELLKAEQAIAASTTAENYNKYQAIRAKIFNGEGEFTLNELCKNIYNLIQTLAKDNDPAAQQKRKQYEALLDYYEFQRLYYSGDYKDKEHYYEAQKRYVRSLRALGVEVIVNCKSSEDRTGKLFIELQVDEIFQRLQGHMPRTMYEYPNALPDKDKVAQYRQDVERCAADVVLTGKNVPGAEGVKKASDARQKKMASLDKLIFYKRKLFENGNVRQEKLDFAQTQNVYQLPIEKQFDQYKAALSECERVFAKNLSHYHPKFKKFNATEVDALALEKLTKILTKYQQLFQSFNGFIKNNDLAKISPKQRHELEKLLAKLTIQFTAYQQYLANQIQRYKNNPAVLQALQAALLPEQQMKLLQQCFNVKEIELHGTLATFLNEVSRKVPAMDDNEIDAAKRSTQPAVIIKPEPSAHATEQAAQSELVRTGNKHIENWKAKLGAKSRDEFTTKDKNLISGAISSASINVTKHSEIVHITPEVKKTFGSKVSGFGFDLNLTKQELSYQVEAGDKDLTVKQRIDAAEMANQVLQLAYSKIEVVMPRAAEKYENFKTMFLKELEARAKKNNRTIEVLIYNSSHQKIDEKTFKYAKNDKSLQKSDEHALEVNSRYTLKN